MPEKLKLALHFLLLLGNGAPTLLHINKCNQALVLARQLLKQTFLRKVKILDVMGEKINITGQKLGMRMIILSTGFDSTEFDQ